MWLLNTVMTGVILLCIHPKNLNISRKILSVLDWNRIHNKQITCAAEYAQCKRESSAAKQTTRTSDRCDGFIASRRFPCLPFVGPVLIIVPVLRSFSWIYTFLMECNSVNVLYYLKWQPSLLRMENKGTASRLRSTQPGTVLAFQMTSTVAFAKQNEIWHLLIFFWLHTA